jgi:hypothetical protein
LTNVQRGNESPLLHFWQVYCVSFVLRSAPLRHPELWPKECPMEFKDYDFIRNPVVQNEVCFLQSKCPACGFSILVRSVEELAGRVPHSAGGRIAILTATLAACVHRGSMPEPPDARGGRVCFIIASYRLLIRIAFLP